MRIRSAPRNKILVKLGHMMTRKKLGKEVDLVNVIGHHNMVTAGFMAAQKFFNRATLVNPRLRELAVLKTAMLIESSFCIDICSMLSKNAGATESQISELQHYKASDKFSDEEKLCIEYAEHMAKIPPHVSKEFFEKLQLTFNEEELVELTMAIAWENARARFLYAFDVKSAEFYKPTDESGTASKNTEQINAR